MIQFPNQPATDYTDPNGADWIYNGVGWVRKPADSKSANPALNNEIVIYEWDAFSLYNGIYSGIYPDSNAAPAQMGTLMLVDNENHLMSTTPDESIPGFYWVKNNGSKVTQAKYLPYVNGENGQGNLGSSICKHGIGRHSVVIDGAVYLVSSNSKNKDFIKITEDGAEFIGNVDLDEDDQWEYTTSQYAANDGGSEAVGLVQSSDTELTVASMGTSKTGTKKYPMLKLATFSIADSSVSNTYYSAVNLPEGNGAGAGVAHSEFFVDPRNTKNMIVISAFTFYDLNPDRVKFVVFYVDTESGSVETIYLEKFNTNMTGSRPINRVQIVQTSADMFSVEVIGTFQGWSGPADVSFYVKLPADRQNMSSTVSAGVNPHMYKWEGKGYKDSYVENNLEIDRQNYGFALHKEPLGATIHSMAINLANTSGYSMHDKNPSNYGIQYHPFAHKYRGHAVDGGDPEELTSGRGFVDIGPTMLAPFRYYTGGNTTSHYVGLLGWRPDTGAAIFALQDMNTKTQYFILVKPQVDDNLRTKARVKNGKVVEGPLRGLEADVDTSGADWFRVYPKTKEVTTFGEVGGDDYTKFVPDALVFDKDLGRVIQLFDEVAMTDVEVAQAKAMEAEEEEIID